MREVTKKIRKRILYKANGNLETHLWFRYHKLLYGRFTETGKKLRGYNKLLDLKSLLKQKEKLDPNLVFMTSMLKATPIIFLLPVRLGSFTHGVPMPITEKKQITFAIKWVIKAAKQSKGSISIPALSEILVSTIYDQGPIYEKIMLTYDTGLKNRHLSKFFK